MSENFEWRLSEDRRMASLITPTNPPLTLQFSAEAMDSLLRATSEVRAAMQPALAADFPTGQTVQAIPNPRCVSEPEAKTGNSVLHIRHPGFGWLHFLLPRAGAAKLAELLKNQSQLPVDETLKPGSPIRG